MDIEQLAKLLVPKAVKEASTDCYLDAVRYGMGVLQMGCDIHWYSETKKNGVWVADQAESFNPHTDADEAGSYAGYPDMHNFPGRNRDYWLFGLLNSGVRTDWPWSFAYRDSIPDDCSSQVQKIYEYWNCDAHSAGSVTRAELKAKREELKLAQAQLLIDTHASRGEREAVPYFIERLERMIANLASDAPDTDQRIVFWFDN